MQDPVKPKAINIPDDLRTKQLTRAPLELRNSEDHQQNGNIPVLRSAWICMWRARLICLNKPTRVALNQSYKRNLQKGEVGSSKLERSFPIPVGTKYTRTLRGICRRAIFWLFYNDT